MKIASLITFILGSASATVEIAVDNNRIENAIHTLEEHGEEIAQSSQDQQYEQALKDAQIRAELEIRQS